jgi:rhomboid protease GluP
MFPGGVKVTSIILLVNGFWFILLAVRLIQSDQGGFGSILMFPREFNESLIRFGALFSPLFSGPGDFWRTIPPLFLHGGLIHFAFNSMVLIQIGPLVEEAFGRERFWTIYLGSGMAGCVATLGWKAFTGGGAFSLGASGAIMGLMGALIAYGTRRGGPVGKRIRGQILYYVGYIFLITLLISRVDHAGHIGGLVGGFVLGWVVPYGVLKSRGSKLFWDGAAVVCVLAAVYAFYQVSQITLS